MNDSSREVILIDKDKKKETRLTYTISILALVLAVVGTSLCFLALTTSFNVNGVSATESYDWEVGFKGTIRSKLTGSAKEYASPTIIPRTTTIENFKVSFEAIGDSVTYTFDVANSGKLDAKVGTIVMGNPICRGTGTTAIDDAKLVCDGIEVKMTYANGKEIEEGDILKKGNMQDINFTVTYNGRAMPKNPVTVEDLGATIIYIQK